MTKRLQLFSRKYPWPYGNLSRIGMLALLVAGFVFAFLYFFEPFEVAKIRNPRTLKLIGYGMVSGLATFLCFGLAYRIFKTKTINGLQELALFLIVFLLDATFTCLYGINVDWSGLSYLSLTGNVFKIWTLLGLMRIIYAYSSKRERIIQETRNDQAQAEQKFQFQSSNQKDFLSINADQLILIKAAGNYSEVFHLREDSLQRTLIRNTLKNLAQQENKLALFQCHRSFLVNLKQIDQLSGNIRNGYIIMHAYPEKVPVGRTYWSALQQKLKADRSPEKR